MSWAPDNHLKETILGLVAVTIWTLYSFFYFFQFMFRFCCGTFFIEFSYIIIYGLSFKHVCWTLNHQNKLQYQMLYVRQTSRNYPKCTNLCYTSINHSGLILILSVSSYRLSHSRNTFWIKRYCSKTKMDQLLITISMIKGMTTIFYF